MKLSFAFSPCPNDTFMFEPIVHQKIDLHHLTFDIIMEDVEYLNRAAINEIPDVTKLSFNAFTKLYDKYQLLTSGSALGNHCGPLLISKKAISVDQVANLKIAIPGVHTTAFLLLKYAFPNAWDFEEMLFSDVENAVLQGDVDAGVIIHENRFTYGQRGLQKVIDLGAYWENQTGSPIPLGGIAIKRSLPEDVKIKVNQIIFDSVQYAFDHPDDGMPFIKDHAQEMDQEVMMSHIRLYVNHHSQKLGQEGKHAIATLFKVVYPDFKDEDMNSLFVD